MWEWFSEIADWYSGVPELMVRFSGKVSENIVVVFTWLFDMYLFLMYNFKINSIGMNIASKRLIGNIYRVIIRK